MVSKLNISLSDSRLIGLTDSETDEDTFRQSYFGGNKFYGDGKELFDNHKYQEDTNIEADNEYVKLKANESLGYDADSSSDSNCDFKDCDCKREECMLKHPDYATEGAKKKKLCKNRKSKPVLGHHRRLSNVGVKVKSKPLDMPTFTINSPKQVSYDTENCSENMTTFAGIESREGYSH
uniref:HUN domain-containing protein n=1 Tax=Rhabditophanes sp. KR3021 TaxID=114890 RepID=A0AC35UBK3_9BILA